MNTPIYEELVGELGHPSRICPPHTCTSPSIVERIYPGTKHLKAQVCVGCGTVFD